MNRYIMIRRLRCPAFLLLVGVNALLAQAHILGWGESWPFYLILAGVFMLAERAALASEGYPGYPGAPCAGPGYSGPGYPGPAQPAAEAPSAPAAETALSLKRHQGFEDDVNGGQR